MSFEPRIDGMNFELVCLLSKSYKGKSKYINQLII